jgi:hypothetical protein
MYNILHQNGKLVGVTNTEDWVALENVDVINVQGPIPDLNKVVWDEGSLSLVSITTPLTRFEFLSKFTSEERTAIRASDDPLVVDYIHMLEIADEVDPTNALTIQGIEYLVSINLLTELRAEEILS